MSCSNCGKTIPSESRFCPICGTRQWRWLKRTIAPVVFGAVLMIGIGAFALMISGGDDDNGDDDSSTLGTSVNTPVVTQTTTSRQSSGGTPVSTETVVSGSGVVVPAQSTDTVIPVTDTPRPTPTLQPTLTPTVTPTPIPPTPMPAEITSPVSLLMEPSGDAKPGQGLLEAAFERIDGPIDGLYVEVYTATKDVIGTTVRGNRVDDGYTSNVGGVAFDLNPGTYIVLADLRGYNWGGFSEDDGLADIVVEAGQRTSLRVRTGRLTFTLATVDQAIESQYVEVYTQGQDVTGNIVLGSRVADGYTANTGAISFTLTPGLYIVVSDLRGYNWGGLTEDEGQVNIAVQPGQDVPVDVRLGRVVVAAKSGSGTSSPSEYIELHTQERDASGKLVVGSRVADGYTDNTGLWSVSVTPGSYAVETGSSTSFDVVVTASQVIEVSVNAED